MRIVIVGGDGDLVRSLADRLDHRECPTVLVANTGDATAIETGLAAAPQDVDEPPVVVRIAFDSRQNAVTPLAATSMTAWVKRAEQPLREACAFHQAAARFLRPTGGRIIVVMPTTGLSGAPGVVPLATAVEGERSLMKAQARVLGADGVTANCVTVAPELLAADSTGLERPGLPPPALSAPTLDQLADLLVAMSGPGFAGITGQTIALDGGKWMAS